MSLAGPPGRDWFKVGAIILGVLALVAVAGGLFLMAAAFLWVGP